MKTSTLVMFIILGALVVASLGYLIASDLANRDAVSKVKSCVVGDPTLVFPGPGLATGPGVYWEGHVLFDRSEHIISWRIMYSGLGTIRSVEIFGPVLPNNTYTGPVLLVLCGESSGIPCLAPALNVMEQKIDKVSPAGNSLRTLVNTIAKDRDVYRIRVKTNDFPDGALVARLGVGC